MVGDSFATIFYAELKHKINVLHEHDVIIFRLRLCLLINLYGDFHVWFSFVYVK